VAQSVWLNESHKGIRSQKVRHCFAHSRLKPEEMYVCLPTDHGSECPSRQGTKNLIDISPCLQSEQKLIWCNLHGRAGQVLLRSKHTRASDQTKHHNAEPGPAAEL
jgi:hypothetical protein